MKQTFKNMMKNRLCGPILTIFSFLILATNADAEHDWTEQVAAYKPMVVNVETSSEVVFETEVKGTNFATGFVVDAKHGIIATNRHVTGSSPCLCQNQLSRWEFHRSTDSLLRSNPRLRILSN